MALSGKTFWHITLAGVLIGVAAVVALYLSQHSFQEARLMSVHDRGLM
jgi:hypothetical protein